MRPKEPGRIRGAAVIIDGCYRPPKHVTLRLRRARDENPIVKAATPIGSSLTAMARYTQP